MRIIDKLGGFKHLRSLTALCAVMAVAACEGKKEEADKGDVEVQPMRTNPFPSTYEPYASEPTLITGATILTSTGDMIENGDIFLKDGKIEAVGEGGSIELPDGDIVTIDGAGKYVTAGLIDSHSHLGVYPSPGFSSTSDGNEAVSPNTAQVWSEHSVWPHDPGFTRAMAGGITAMQILPGSANLFGGRTVTLKNVPSRTVQGMKFPGAPYGIKMACGENPKRVYGNKGGPSTRMANFAGYRAAWIDAADYKKKWDEYTKKASNGEKADPPKRDLKKETLAGVLSGDLFVNMHCYRADEMAQVLDMSEEFGYKVRSFHHAVEGYKAADMMAENDICASIWADWWGFKLEAYDGVRANAALIHNQPNSCVVMHSDSAVGIQRLNQEVAKAVADGAKIGINIPPEEAIKWITSNPAKMLGILDQTGTLEAGKAADVVVWNGTPFSVYAKAEQVFVDGALLYDALNGISPRMDFEIGQQENGTTGGAGQ